MRRAKTYSGNNLREFGAISMDCCRFETVDMYAAKESTTALTKASLASERLDETERSTAVGSEGYKKLIQVASFIPLNSENLSCAFR